MSTTTIPKTMRAAVVHIAGGPENLILEDRTVPTPKAGEVLIKVHAFGLNRAEMFTRQGHSPDVPFPRILGIEAAGTVASAPGGEFEVGTPVATVMGGMGRQRDGSYAEYTLQPANQLRKVSIEAGWEIVGAIPEMMQTAWGCLFKSLQLKKGEKLLIRGGSSSVGLAAAALAKQHGCFVVSTTRSEKRIQLLKNSGADDVLIDTNDIIANEALKRYSEGFDKILELVGVVTLEDSLKTVRQPGGIVCIAGIVGGKWLVENWQPYIIPSGSYLTTYRSEVSVFKEMPFDDMAEVMCKGELVVPVRTFTLGEIVEAHRVMEGSGAEGKIVVLV